MVDKIIWPKPGTYILAVSGGVDSVTLLDLLAHYSKEPPWRLVVAHFDHGIRKDSAKDAALVKKLAQAYKLPFESAKGQLGPAASEATARRARYEFLEALKTKHQAKAIITAHHLDDKLETVLLNLRRGTGRRGLAPFKSRPDILRPLQNLYKEELVKYARSKKLNWREDTTNQDTKYRRNAVRHDLLPRMEAVQPGFKNWLANFLQSLEKDSDTIEKILSQLYTRLAKVTDDSVVLERKSVISMSQHLAQEFMHYTLSKLKPGVDITAPQIKRLVHFCKTAQPRAQLQISGELRALAGYDRVTFTYRAGR